MKTERHSETGGGKIIVVAGLAAVLVLGAVVYAAMALFDAEPIPAGMPGAASVQHVVQTLPAEDAVPFRVYYFHRTVRCPSCETIETLSKAVVEEDFQAELALSKLTWKVFNLDDEPNRHFEDDYSLQAQSVILSEVRDGKEVRWKNLENVWDLLGDEAAFRNYIKQEVQLFLAGQQENES